MARRRRRRNAEDTKEKNSGDCKNKRIILPDTNYVDTTATGLKFKPVSGNYKISVNTDTKTVMFKRVNADGTDATFADDGTGALWLMAWGVGAPSQDFQFGFDPGKAYCMPERLRLINLFYL